MHGVGSTTASLIVSLYSRFIDLTQTFPLYRGKGSRDPDEQANQSVGAFKGSIKLYPLPDDGSPEPDKVLSNIPSTDPVDVVVRVYVVKVSPTTLLEHAV